MEKDQIVVVTQMDDPHADDVILMLQQLGHDPVRLNTDDVPTNVKMSINCGGADAFGASIEVLTNGRVIDAGAVKSVWWRKPAAFDLPGDLSLQEREFATGEIEHALMGLWASLDCYWISHPERIRSGSWKGKQLLRASQMGFEVPRTLVTNDPDEARNFFHACNGRMVFKVMTDPFLGAMSLSQKQPDQPLEDYETSTTLVTESELDLLESVRLVPCLFQEYVPKRLEFRVTVVGDEVFAVEIHSQEDERTAVDWRQYDVEIPYKEAVLPEEVADRCLALVRSYGLNFSAMDLILTPDGRYVFVENNPNGQFIFVEELVPELAMTEALAACLIRGSNG